MCAVVAVLQQESGFQADPPVANLGTLVRTRLEEEAEKYGPLGPAGDGAAAQGACSGGPADLRAAHPAAADRARARPPLPRHARGRAPRAPGDGRHREPPRHPLPRPPPRGPEPGHHRRLDAGERALGDGLRAEPRLARRRAGGPRRAVHPRRRAALRSAAALGLPADRRRRRSTGSPTTTPVSTPRATPRCSGRWPGSPACRSRPTETSWSSGPTAGPPRTTARRCGPSASSASASSPPCPRRGSGRTSRRARSWPSRRRPATSRSGASTGNGPGAPCPAAAVPELELKSPKLRRGYSTAAYARNVLRHHRACLQRLRGDAPE